MRSFQKMALTLGVCCALLACAPLVLSTYAYYVIASWMVFAIAASGLNVPFGFTKLHCFGQGAFMLIGAYSTATAVAFWHWPLWAGCLLAIFVAGTLGMLIALPTRRLKGFALAILTFTLALTLARTVKGLEFMGGPQGITMPPVTAWGLTPALFAYELTLAVFAVCMLMLLSVMHSKSGHAMRSVGSNDIVAQAVGINPLKYRVLSMVLSAVFGALAGCLQPLLVGYVAPDSYDPSLSIVLFAAVMIGGMGTFAGPLVGALFIVLMPELTQGSRHFSEMIFAVAFLCVTIVFPSGLMGLVALLVGHAQALAIALRTDSATVRRGPA